MATPRKKVINWLTAPAATSGAWRTIVAAGEVGAYRDADVLLARDAWNGRDRELARALEDDLSRRMQGWLAKRLANRRYGRAHDVWQTREQDFLVGLLAPNTSLGISMRKSFPNFADWGTVDLVRKDMRQNPATEALDERIADGDPAREASDRLIDLRAAMKAFAAGDDRRFEVVTYDAMGHTQVEIAGLVGVSDRTVRQWLADFGAFKRARGIG